MNKLILCVDLGSSSVRCSLYELVDDLVVEGNDGRAAVQVVDGLVTGLSWQAVHPHTGRLCLQQDDDRSLFAVVEACIDETLQKLATSTKSDGAIVAVGFSSLVMNLLGVDAAGQPVGEEATLTYACHGSAVAAKVQELQGQLGPDGLRDLYQATGAPLHASYALPQLCTYYDQHPDSPVVEWQSIASHCLHRWLEGAKSWPISYTEASWMGLLRTADCVYEPRALQLLPPTRVQALPKVADFDDEGTLARARLCPTYAQRWPALSYARFFLGLGDGACANVGSKCTSRHRIACTIGTSAAARVVWPAHSMPGSVPPGLFVYRVNRDYLLLGGALTDGGSIIAWIQELLHIQTDDELQACLLEVQDLLEEDYRAAIEGTAHRPVVMLPFLSGERSTNFQSGATGALLGLTRSTTRAHLVKSCLEGVTLRLAAIVRLIPSADAEIWVSGKALEVNTLWRQMIADCTGQTVVLDSETHEGSSRGAACLIATSLSGQRELVEEEATCVLKTEPRADAKAYWSGLVQSQESFLDAMRPIYASCS